MKKTSILTLALAMATTAMAEPKNVTKNSIENPDFGARFAAWVNPGKFTYNTNNSFEMKSGEVWMEKWVAKGSTLGSNTGMYQTLRGLPDGTYTLVASAKNVSQSSPSKVCTGAYLFAGQEQTAFNKAGDYSVVFTVANGKADIGVNLKNCTGNWVCIDNFRLYYNGVNADSLATEKARLAEEEETLREKIANATVTSLKVSTYDFVPTGNTIALGRSTVSGTAKEKGFCWSTQSEPTIFDEKTTETFDNNGAIYVMRGLKPATAYYVRAYAMTSGGYVAYGNVKKIVTLPAGNMSYGFYNDNGGDEETCARINSASAECVWMYNNLSYIPGFFLSVHYVPGSGAGGGTADCSYGGWMRVSQTQSYQQTGTMLHETNHGVGVGTTGEWYSNSNLRAETSRGTWLGPMATKVVRFFENSSTATMTGDGTHMWPYGINGAHEDSYQPSNQCLYYANILITHAMHQDGLPCTKDVGFASPAYVFEQNDTVKYYIKSNDEQTGLLTSYLRGDGTKPTWNAASAFEVLDDDTYAWYVKYDPSTRYYYLQNVATGKLLSCGSSWTLSSKTAPSANEKLHFMPARVDTKIGSTQKTAYWVMKPNRYDSMTLEATTTGGVSAKKIDLTNAATKQQWLFLTADEMESFDEAAMSGLQKEVDEWIAQCKRLLAVPHVAGNDSIDLSIVDSDFETAIFVAENAEDYATIGNAIAHIDAIKQAMVDFLAKVKPEMASQPFDLTFLLDNPGFDKDASGWSETPAWGNQCCEYYQKNFDLNQTIQLTMPAGTYQLCANAFQRPGTLDDIYNDFVLGGRDKVNATLYIKTKNQKIKNICADAQAKSIHSDAKKIDQLGYIPNTMASSQAWFKKGYYDNSLVYHVTSSGKLKVGIKSTSNSGGGYWVCIDNFRLYYYGEMTVDDVTTPVLRPMANPSEQQLYDLQGRRVEQPRHGLYIRGGKKILF